MSSGSRSSVVRRRIVIVTVLAGLALALHFLPQGLLSTHEHEMHGVSREELLHPMQGPALADVVFGDQFGESFGRDDFIGRWTLLFFGFTSCPDVCPMTLGLLARVWDALEAYDRAVTEQSRVVMISVDPERDTQEVLREYVGKFNPEFTALRADIETVKRFADPLGVVLQRVEDHDHSQHAHGHTDHTAEGYDVQHTTAILLVAPDATVITLFSPPHEYGDIVRRVLKHQSEYSL